MVGAFASVFVFNFQEGSNQWSLVMDSLFCYHIVLLFVAAIAFCLLWIGFATPGWFVVTVQEETARKEYTVSSVNRYGLLYIIFTILWAFLTWPVRRV